MGYLFGMSPVLVAVGTLCLAAVAIKIHGSRFSDKRRRRYHPVAGTILHFLFNYHRLLDFITELTRQRKTYRMLRPLRAEVYTADPVNIEHFLSGNFSNYGKAWYHHGILSDLLGDGIFTVDGVKWKHQRKAASYQFSTRLLKDFSSSVFRTNAVKLAGIVSQAAISDNTVELQDLFMKSALDSVFKVVLGVELDTVCGTYEEGTRFSNAFDEASTVTMYRYVDIFWKIKRLLNIGSEAVLKNNIRVVDQFVYKVIKTKIQQVQNQPDDSSVVNGDLLSRFIELKETDPKYLKDIVLSFIIAGKDTTGSTLSWFVYMLCKNPHIQEKIAQEIWESTKVRGGHIIAEELAARVTEEALEKMQYLHATLTETLRLYPAIPLEGKYCFSDDMLPDGFTVRKGDIMVFCPYAMGRMKYLWGDDAELFKPERWLDHNGIFQHESSFKLTAFQAGPRICLGKEFAYRQMKIFAAVLVGCFKLELADQKKSVKERTMLTLQIDGGLHVLASHRSSL